MKYVLVLSLAASVGLGAAGWVLLRPPSPDTMEVHVLDVYPGQSIQAALDQAASLSGHKIVRVHAGTYQPTASSQALIHFNARHDGITLEAVGTVTLTAANPAVADRKAASYPAIVSHVVYFGDGISRRTVLRGFHITGANGFVQGPPDLEPIRTRADLLRSVRYVSHASTSSEPNASLPRTHYFFTDGGAILVYGRSFPTIEHVEMHDNYSSVCAAGLSVQHYGTGGLTEGVLVRDCIFRNNRAAVSGPAVDLLSPGSSAVLDNCLFVGNIANVTIDANGRSGYGAVTVFPRCRVSVRHCTFTDNSAGVDDRGTGSSYTDSIFWNNRRAGGVNPQPRFELDITDPTGVRGCFIHGEVNDLRSNISTSTNTLDAPNPEFDSAFRPQHVLYQQAGYRPTESSPH